MYIMIELIIIVLTVLVYSHIMILFKYDLINENENHKNNIIALLIYFFLLLATSLFYVHKPWLAFYLFYFLFFFLFLKLNNSRFFIEKLYFYSLIIVEFCLGCQLFLMQILPYIIIAVILIKLILYLFFI